MYYRIINKPTNKALNLKGSYLLDITTRTNVTLYSQTGSNEQVWAIDTLNGVTKVRSYVNETYGLNIVGSTSNCDVIPIAGNEADSNIQFELQSDGYYKIKNVNRSKYLTPVGTSDGANVEWQQSSQNENQKWGLIAITEEQIDRERTEYYLEPAAGNSAPLGVGGFYRLSSSTSPTVSGGTRENKYKWFFKGNNPNMKIYSKHGDDFALCVDEEIMGRSVSFSSVVKENPSDYESCVTIIPYSNDSTLYEIKHTATNLYLTYHNSEYINWSPYNNTNHELMQVWHIYNYPFSEANGVDTDIECNETTRNALFLGKEEFVIRYYAPFTYNGKKFFAGNNTLPANCTLNEIEGININAITINDVTLHDKNLKQAEINLFRNKQLDIVTIYQNAGKKDADHPNEFTELAAHIAAFSSLTCAHIFQQPVNSAIYFAVDYDVTSDEDFNELYSYFSIIKQKLSAAGYKVGVYGSGLVCSQLKNANLVEFTWLAASNGWSGSSSYSNYNIKQGEYYYYNQVEFDDNVAMKSLGSNGNYGQWYYNESIG